MWYKMYVQKEEFLIKWFSTYAILTTYMIFVSNAYLQIIIWTGFLSYFFPN